MLERSWQRCARRQSSGNHEISSLEDVTEPLIMNFIYASEYGAGSTGRQISMQGYCTDVDGMLSDELAVKPKSAINACFN